MGRYFLRQCVLERPALGGVECRQGWIPELYATLNRVLRIDEDGIVEDGWVVKAIGGRRSCEEQSVRSQDYRRHRRGSDIGRKQALDPLK